MEEQQYETFYLERIGQDSYAVLHEARCNSDDPEPQDSELKRDLNLNALRIYMEAATFLKHPFGKTIIKGLPQGGKNRLEDLTAATPLTPTDFVELIQKLGLDDQCKNGQLTLRPFGFVRRRNT